MSDLDAAEMIKRANSGPKDLRPPGSRNIVRDPTVPIEDKLRFFVLLPLRAILCIALVTVFFVTYFGYMLPILPLRYVWPRLYWFLEGKLYRWLQSFIAYWGYTAGYDIYEFGDIPTEVLNDERVLVMCNHQSTADVPTLMSILQSKGVASRKTIWLMDIMFRWTPFGIIGHNHGDYFITQGKATRDKEIGRLKSHLTDVFWNRDRRWVILFPEGGFYYKRVESSQAYGKKNGFPHLKYITLPRQGAVKAILDEVGPRDDNEQPRKRSQSRLDIVKEAIGAVREKKYVKVTRPPIKYILDITIAYPNGIPLSLATIGFGTREKCDIAVHYNVFLAKDVPYESDTELRDWMYKVYEENDKKLGNYYTTGKFVDGDEGQRINFSWDLSLPVFLSYTRTIPAFVDLDGLLSLPLPLCDTLKTASAAINV